MTTIKLVRFITSITLAFWIFSASAKDGQRIISWNMEWLSSVQSSKISTPLREESDYQIMADQLTQISPDIIAFQEVNDEEALRKVIGNHYQLYFSDRKKKDNSQHQFEQINQYTGFAIKPSLTVNNQSDLRLDNKKGSKLRFASYLVLEPNSTSPLHLLSIHLKAGCSGAYKNNTDCRALKQQAQTLNEWIIQRELKGERYMLLGDFNHNLAYPNDWLWRVMTQNSDARLATKYTQPLCKVKSRNNPNRTHQFRSLIDHIVISKDVATSHVEQWVFPVNKVLENQLSDHCPLAATFY